MEHLPHEAVNEIITTLVWLFIVTGTALMAVVGWIARMGMRYVGTELAGIRLELIETNKVLTAIDKDLRTELVDLDRRKTGEISAVERRMTIIETQCQGRHIGQGYEAR